MTSTPILIELYDNMPTNEIEDCKSSGEFIKLNYKDGIRLIGILFNQGIEFVVWNIDDCLIDMSYNYKDSSLICKSELGE